MWSLEISSMLIPQWIGLLRHTSVLVKLTTVTSSLIILNDLNVGRVIYCFARLWLVTTPTSKCLRVFSMVFPYTELFMSLNRSFSKAFLAACRFSVKIDIGLQPPGLIKFHHPMNFRQLHTHLQIELQVTVMDSVISFIPKIWG